MQDALLEAKRRRVTKLEQEVRMMKSKNQGGANMAIFAIHFFWGILDPSASHGPLARVENCKTVQRFHLGS